MGFYNFGDGVSRYDGSNLVTFTVEDGLVSKSVVTIFLDIRNNLWFGTNRGISYYDGTNWHTFTTEDGLASNSVYAIAQDSDGNMWFGTCGGVSCYHYIND